METATATALVPATLVGFLERRRAGSVPPRDMVFVERRRPAPVHVVDVEDLHEADLHGVLSGGLDYGFGGAEAPLGAAALLAGLIASSGAAALAAHDLRPVAAELLG
ncbi:hypothetical protein GCM10010531_10920 [Blastococcus jejuensis]|uniref:Uncharacterized protein n=1 Tax=Blastococcus jejuensis TaxID=351224 RepID=A0ABP6NYI2_9ACTN